MNNISDQLAQEIRKMQQGNFNDYEAFYNMTSMFIGRMVNAVIKDQTQSYAVINEVYTTIYNRVGELEDLEQFYKWAGAITTDVMSANVAKALPQDAPMRANVNVAKYASEDGELIIPDKLMPDQRFRSMLQNMMEEIPLTHKLVMQYYYFEGKSVDEIAKRLYKDDEWVEKIISDIKSRLIYIVNQFPEYAGNPRKSLYQMPVFWIVFAAAAQIPVGLLATGTVAAAGAAGVISGAALGSAAAGGVAGGAAASGGAAAAVGSISGAASGASGAGAASAVSSISGAASGASAAGATGIFATVGAKVAIGVAVAALVAGGGVAAYCVATKDKDEDTEITEEAHVAADDTEAATEGAKEEAATEEPTTEEEEERVDYAAIYLDVLEEYRDSINTYDQWRIEVEDMIDYDYDYDSAYDAPIAITDITGDDVPELIFIHAGIEKYYGSLEIYTINEGRRFLIYEEEYFDVQAGGGTSYFLFKRGGDDHLYARSQMSDDFSDEAYYRFDISEDGTLVTTMLISAYTEPNEDYTDVIGTYSEGDEEIDEDYYYELQDNLVKETSELLIYNFNSIETDDVYKYMSVAEQKYMSYAEAVEYLEQFLSEEELAERETALPLTEDVGFVFTSGAGAWDTSMTVSPDGSFSGQYHDSDMGSGGDGYDGTMYICNFTGRFKNIQKVSDYVYSMELDYIEYAEEGKDSWIETENDWRTLYVPSEAYGVYPGTTFYLYLPGASTDDIPEAFSDWYSWDDNLFYSGKLLSYGLYNVDEEYPFLGSSQE